MSKKQLNWGEKRYYSSYKDDSFMNTPIAKEKQIKDNYKYLPRRGLIVNFLKFFFYYFIAIPVLWLFLKLKFGVKVKGKKNLKKIKGGYILIGNHSSVADPCIASVMVAWPKKNFIVANKDAVEVPVGRFFTTTLGALPLPDQPKGLANLSNAIGKILKKGRCVTIYPEAAIWPYYTGLRPLPSASFHYAVKNNAPVVPFAVTYRYAKGKNYLKKKPKINVTILEPVYPNKDLSPLECKNDMAKRTEDALRKVIETSDNVMLYDYVPQEQKKEN